MERVLLIRPPEESQTMGRILESKGIEFCHYPLFKPLFFPVPPLHNPQALIITSKNAIRALQGYEGLREIPLYAVGDETAEFAKQTGFSNVMSASGTSQELIKLIMETAGRDQGVLWHLSGEIVKGNIIEALKSAGFEAKRQIVYQIEGVLELPDALYGELKNHRISHVIFCSSKTTTLFINLLKKIKIKKMACQIIALCLSHHIRGNALDLQWKQIWVSPKPNIQDLMRYFDGEK